MHGLQEFVLGRLHIAFLLGVHVENDQVCIALTDQRGKDLVHCVDRNVGNDLLVERILNLNAGHCHIVEEMLLTFTDIAGAVRGLAVVVESLRTAHELAGGTLVLGGGEPMSGGTINLCHHGLNSLTHASFLGNNLRAECLRLVGEQEFLIVGHGMDEGRVGVLT